MINFLYILRDVYYFLFLYCVSQRNMCKKFFASHFYKNYEKYEKYSVLDGYFSYLQRENIFSSSFFLISQNTHMCQIVLETILSCMETSFEHYILCSKEVINVNNHKELINSHYFVWCFDRVNTRGHKIITKTNWMATGFIKAGCLDFWQSSFHFSDKVEGCNFAYLRFFDIGSFVESFICSLGHRTMSDFLIYTWIFYKIYLKTPAVQLVLKRIF